MTQASEARGLQVPHFHHEFVKKAATLAVEQPERLLAVVALLESLFTMSLVTETQMGMGFQRMRETVGDLELDVPGATLRLSQVITHPLLCRHLAATPSISPSLFFASPPPQRRACTAGCPLVPVSSRSSRRPMLHAYTARPLPSKTRVTCAIRGSADD